MTLDRNRVDRTAAEHIRRLARRGPLPADEQRRIRKLHERIAQKVAARTRRQP